MMKFNLSLSFLLVLATFFVSCSDGSDNPSSDEVNTQAAEEDQQSDLASNSMEQVVSSYLNIKNALVASDQEAAAEAGSDLLTALGNLKYPEKADVEQEEFSDIVEDAREHAEHISESPLDHQREHFAILSDDLNDLIEIFGSQQTLYQTYCPMYNNNKGAYWLSETEEIRNPYYGDKMLKCGEVKKEY